MTFPRTGGPQNSVERRYYTCDDIEIRAADEGSGEPSILVGYAAVFDETSEDLGGFRERIAPGAFAKTLGGDVRALFNHDPNIILGRTAAGTLRLSEDNRGLKSEITMPNTSAARDIMESIRLGNINQMSFGFRTNRDKWDEVDGKLVRTLIDVSLLDVSPVTFPAYPQTEIAKRSLAAWQAEQAPAPDYSLEYRRLALLGV